MTNAEIKALIADRLKGLQAKKTEVQAAATAQVADLNKQITALQTLAQNFDTLSFPDALIALADTGIRLELKS